MPNPTVTIEIKEIGSAAVIKRMREVQGEAGRLVGANRRVGTQAGKTASDFKKSGKTVGKFSELMRDLETSTVLAIGPLSGLGARVRALSVLFTRSGIALTLFFSGLVAATVAIGTLITKSVKAGREFERMQLRLVAATGGFTTARLELEKVAKVSDDLGIDIRSASEGFSSLAAAARGTSLEGQGVRDVFRGVATAIAALRLPAEQAGGVITALEQILTKGRVSAEEINQQLGDRLPGAARIAARAIGVTTGEFQQLLRQGKLLSEDFLPKFAAEMERMFSPAASQNVHSFQGAINRLNNSFFELFNTIEARLGLLEKFADILNNIADTVEFWNKVIGNARSETKQFIDELSRDIPTFELAGILKEQKTELMARGKAFLDPLKEEIKKLRPLYEEALTLPRGAGLMGTSPQDVIIERFQKLVKEATRLQVLMDKLTNVPVRKPGEKQGLPIDANALARLQRNFEKLRDTVQVGGQNMFDILAGNIEKVERRTAQLAATDFLRNFKPEVVQAFTQKMYDLGVITEATTGSLKDYIAGTMRLKDAQDNVVKAFEGALSPAQQYRLELEKLKVSAAAAGVSLNQLAPAIENMNRSMQQTLGGPEFLRSMSPEQIRATAEQLGLTTEQLSDIARVAPSTEDALQTISSIFQDTRTPLEDYKIQMENLLELQERFPQFADTVQRGMDNIRASMLATDPFIGPVIDGFQNLGSAITDMVKNGTSALESLLDIVTNIFTQILEQAIKLMIINPILNSIFGFAGGGGFPTAGGSLFGGMIPTNILGLPGFQHGGDFKVGGSGGPDSQLVMFRATPGEPVKVGGGSGQEGDKLNFTQVNNFGSSRDPRRDFRRATPSIAADVVSILRSVR